VTGPGHPPIHRLRVYLGTAPGVGKTYAMLNEGGKRAEAGERVVVGWIERHGREQTRAQLGDLEVVPPRLVHYRGVDFEELDVAAVLDRRPDVVLVDELAHALPGGHRQRWEDVRDLLAAGVDVLTTVNLANLASAREAAAAVTGVSTTESVPDEFVRNGEAVLVDPHPEVLRRRLAAGQVYSADRVGGALSNYFKAVHLEALSELAQAWLAGTFEETAAAVTARLARSEAMTRPVLLAGLSASEFATGVIQRATALAEASGGDLVAVHVHVNDGLAHQDSSRLAAYRALVEDLGGSFVEVHGGNVAEALAREATERHATRVVVARHRSAVNEVLHGSVARQLRRLLPAVEIDEVRPAG